MKYIRHISDKDITEEEIDILPYPVKTRQAVRAVLFNRNSQIALIYSGKHKVHKLPGGGMDEGEIMEATLKREVKEEVGCECVIESEIGIVTELRTNFSKYKQGLFQVSYCFVARVDGDRFDNELTELEKEEQMVTKWYTLSEAISIIEKEKPTIYEKKFIRLRDLTILDCFKNSTEAINTKSKNSA